MTTRLLLLLSILLVPLAVPAQSDEPLTVGVTASPPFSYEQNGEWTGMTIELWSAVAEEMGVDYSLRPMTLSDALDGLAAGEVDLVAAALVTTAEREREMNFSNSFFSSGLGVATATRERSPVLAFVGALFSLEAALALGALALLLLIVGFVLWMAERKRNPEQFGGGVTRGIGSGFWWSAVTMTTVGYGDKAPVSLPGRIVGLVWMFASIVLLSGFTGAIASSLTISSLAPEIESFEDLYGARVGVVADSNAAEFLLSRGISTRFYEDTSAGLEAVSDGKIDGFVNDAPVLRHYAARDFVDDVSVLEETFEPGFYAIGFREGLGQEEALNRALLNVIQSPRWEQIRLRHLGE